MKIEKVVVAGGGTLGSQIAWQTASRGFDVTIYDAFSKGLERSKMLHEQFSSMFRTERNVSKEHIKQTFERLSYTTELAIAVKDADIVIEAVPESLEIKKEFYINLSSLAPAKTIFASNSSTLLPGDFAEFTGRPEKFLALHFANQIWDANIGEIMGHSGTDKAIFDRVVKFASEIGMVPIPIYKEQNGYILNSLLMPFLNAAVDLLSNNVASHESIDKCWSISMGRQTLGPCAIMDIIGIKTVYDIGLLWAQKTGDAMAHKRVAFIKENFIDKGRLGAEAGVGFYTYPNPKYLDEDFLK